MLRPYAVARAGVYIAFTAAVMSAWLGQRAGAPLDLALLRSIFVFVIFTALGFGAEAVFSFGGVRSPEETPSPLEGRDE